MCVDMLEAQRVIEKYTQMLPAFEDSREYTLLKVSSSANYLPYPLENLICSSCSVGEVIVKVKQQLSFRLR